MLPILILSGVIEVHLFRCSASEKSSSWLNTLPLSLFHTLNIRLTWRPAWLTWLNQTWWPSYFTSVVWNAKASPSCLTRSTGTAPAPLSFTSHPASVTTRSPTGCWKAARETRGLPRIRGPFLFTTPLPRETCARCDCYWSTARSKRNMVSKEKFSQVVLELESKNMHWKHDKEDFFTKINVGMWVLNVCGSWEHRLWPVCFSEHYSCRWCCKHVVLLHHEHICSISRIYANKPMCLSAVSSSPGSNQSLNQLFCRWFVQFKLFFILNTYILFKAGILYVKKIALCVILALPAPGCCLVT